MSKISLVQEVKQSQKIALTPQLLQAIKLLELTNIELGEYLDQEVIDNPFLENDDAITEDDDIPERREDNETSDEKILTNEESLEFAQEESAITDETYLYSSVHSFEDESNNFLLETLASKTNLFESLREQVIFSILKPEERIVAYALIEYLEPSGFLKISLRDLSSELNISQKTVHLVLGILKKFDPVGIFSQSLEECLGAQLNEMGYLDEAMVALLDNLDLLVRGDIKKISKICFIDEKKIKEMVKFIRKCKPHPINTYDNDFEDKIPPDIIAKKEGRKWIVSLNEETLPKVILLSGYWEELSRKKISKEDKRYLSGHYASGKWLTKALEQRAATILRVAREVMKRQRPFLDHGLMHLKPMILKDIAEELGFHESTISRITNSKVISTPRGSFELKFFFSKAVESSSMEGRLSSSVVKEKIADLIRNEGDKVLSDNSLKGLLKDDRIDVARRTITKYREAMNLPPSFERKRMKRLAV